MPKFLLNSILSEIFETIFITVFFSQRLNVTIIFLFDGLFFFHIFHRHTENWQAVTMLFNLTMFLIYHQFPAKPIVHIHDHWFSKMGQCEQEYLDIL